MPLVKQPVEINFAGGLDSKTDPYQVAIGKFSRLQNTVFDTYKRMTKRNGYGQITTATGNPNLITTFDGNLTAIGSTLQAYVQGSNSWVTKGNLQPVSLETLSLIRSNTTQTQVDTAVSSNNLVCTVFTDTGSGSTVYKYALADSLTGQNIIAPTAIPINAGTVTTAPRVFLLGSYFIILFGGSGNRLHYCSINSSVPTAPSTSITLSSQFSQDSKGNFDGVVVNNTLYLAWNGTDGGGAIRACKLSSTLVQSTVRAFTGKVANIMSVSADTSGSTPNIYVSFWTTSTTNGWTLVLDAAVSSTPVLNFTQVITTTAITNLTATATSGVQTLLFEVTNAYSYDSSIPTNYIKTVTCTVTGTVGSATVFARSVGLASKAFLHDSLQYALTVYYSANQPTYFLLNVSGQVVSRLAYSNAGGYYTTGLPSVGVSGDEITLGYRYQDLIVPVNKDQGVSSSSAVYAQTGLNLGRYTFNTTSQVGEIGNTLNLTGGFLWSYDGYSPVENNFFLWPDSVKVTTATGSGSITAQQYYYQALYEWTDNQGNINRSAPSIPVTITTTTSSSTNTIKVPTLRLTYKTANPVKIVLFRWSVAQQTYYQVTSISSPTFNDMTADFLTITDTLADASILGNSIIYTTGGVIENISAPSFTSVTLFDSRLWGIDAEDDSLWYSKQVIPTTPVEMSDLFTLYVAPTIGVSGSTGKSKCIFPMDDKLIIFKKDALYYISGSGPDNTGANSQYIQPTFIAGTVGCQNQQSIVFMPQGLMFQSDKGIWLLDRGLNTSYLGAPVEQYTTNATVQSAVSVPGTNRILFTMDRGITLVYDYFFNQWGTFTGISAFSACIYQDLHTFINSTGAVYQETPGVYLDGSRPVLQSFTTSWISASGLIGLQRAYWFNLLGTYYSPHKLDVQVAYDYDSNPTQQTLIEPSNYGGTWGTDVPVGDPGIWGGSGVWGGATPVEQERVFFEQQKCKSFQIQVDEVFDPSFGTAAGAGLTLSGINFTIGVKKAYPTPSAANSFG